MLIRDSINAELNRFWTLCFWNWFYRLRIELSILYINYVFTKHNTTNISISRVTTTCYSCMSETIIKESFSLINTHVLIRNYEVLYQPRSFVSVVLKLAIEINKLSYLIKSSILRSSALSWADLNCLISSLILRTYFNYIISARLSKPIRPFKCIWRFCLLKKLNCLSKSRLTPWVILNILTFLLLSSWVALILTEKSFRCKSLIHIFTYSLG